MKSARIFMVAKLRLGCLFLLGLMLNLALNVSYAEEALNKVDNLNKVDESEMQTASAAELRTLLGTPPSYIKANFESTRYIKTAKRVFTSTGLAEISQDYGICWRMVTPRVKTFKVSSKSGGAGLMGLDFLEALIHGDTKTLDQTFTMGYQGTAEEGLVFFRPKGELGRVIFSINAAFKHRLMTSVTAINQDGSSTKVIFKDFNLKAPQNLTEANFCREE